MFILLGFPREEESDGFTVQRIERHYEVLLRPIHIPSFTGVSLEGIINQVERLNGLEKGCDLLLRALIKGQRELDPEFTPHIELGSDIPSSISWSQSRFSTSNVEDALDMLSEEYARIREIYDGKVRSFEESKRDYVRVQKLTRGNLCDMDLNILINKEEEHEFLKLFYVVVQKDRVNEFYDMVNECAFISRDVVDEVGSDEEYVLFKMYSLLKNEDEVRNKINSAGFIIKTLESRKGSILGMSSESEERFSTSQTNLGTFMRTHYPEVFVILVHVKLLKLFVESVYRYGLPTEYLFFVSEGSRERVLKKCGKLARDWPSDRIVFDEDGNNYDENDAGFAFSCINRYGVDEE
jgi:V-type H+-transporting ATPase subunit C